MWGGSEKRSGKCVGMWGKVRRDGGGVACVGVSREVKNMCGEVCGGSGKCVGVWGR